MCVCEGERERERERVCARVRVCENKREGEKAYVCEMRMQTERVFGLQLINIKQSDSRV